ncbi:LOW QUALITY PROTEIN: hypothetical protein PHMEG_00034846, partial [Phytophthora megakarya]
MTCSASQLTTKKDGNRPPINGDTPVANKTLGQCLNAMLDTSSWIQLFAPKAARQAVRAEVVEELSFLTRLPVIDSPRRLDRVGSRHGAATVKTETQGCIWKQGSWYWTTTGGSICWIKSESSEHSVAKDAKKTTRAVFGSAEQSPYFHDAHMVTPRSESRKGRVVREAEQTESTANTRPGTTRGVSSNDEGNPFYQDDDENDATTELVWQIRELTAMEEMDPTPRSEIANIDCWITPFRGKLDESENSMQWLRGFVNEMKGTCTSPNEWCMAFQLSLRDGAVHWHRALSRKTKCTWSLLSDKFISNYCSQFSQSASTRAKRSDKEHIRDYLNRMNGYARSANIKFERSGREAKGHVKHFLETCGDQDLERQLTPMQLRDIHTLEDIVSDIQKVKKRVSNRSSSQSSSRRDDKRHTSSSGSYRRHDNRCRSQERSRSEPRHTSRVALAEASVTDLITELRTRSSPERLDEYSNDYSNEDPSDFYEEDEADQDECESDCGSRDEMQEIKLWFMCSMWWTEPFHTLLFTKMPVVPASARLWQ